MKKFICIDTCIFVEFCLLETQEKETVKEVLDAFYLKLKANDFILLLPENIKLELPRVIRESFDSFKAEAKDLKLQKGNPQNSQKIKALFTSKLLEKRMQAKIQDKIDECIEEIKLNITSTQEIIQEIFINEKVVQIKVDSDVLLEAYKDFLAGRKPMSKGRGLGPIQSDCIIIASLEKFLKSETNYQLFLCSSNVGDFADQLDTNDIKINKEIENRFSHIKYYTNLLSLLNIEFGASYNAEVVEKFSENSLPKIDESAELIGQDNEEQSEVIEKLTGTELSEEKI